MIWKMVGWLGKTVAAGLIISFLSIWTTGYIVNSYVETLLKQFNLPLEMQPVALDGVWGALWGADPQLKEKETQTADTGKSDSSGGSDKTEQDNEGKTGDKIAVDGSGSSGADTGNAGSANSSQADEGKEGSDPLAVDAFGDLPNGTVTDIGGGTGTKANSGATAEEGGTAQGEASEGGVAMSTEELNAAKDQISDADKAELFNVMMTKLPQDAWQKISTMMEEGLTSVEMTDVQQLIAQYLTREEYDRMMEILKKY